MQTARTPIVPHRSTVSSDPRFAPTFALVTLVAVMLGSACSRRSPSAEEPTTGIIAIGLNVAGTSEITKVSYNITRGGTSILMGTLDLTMVPAPQVLIKGVPTGSGLLVELSAVSTDSLLHCNGSVMVDVL